MKEFKQAKFYRVAVASALLAMAGGAFAQEDDNAGASYEASSEGQAGQEDVGMASYDANSDGRISQDEASSNTDLETNFTRYDQNGDGSLDESEFSRFEEEELPATEPGVGGESPASGAPMNEAPIGGDPATPPISAPPADPGL